MSNTLLEQAATDGSLMTSVATAVKSAYPGLSLSSVSDVQAFVSKVEADPAELAKIEASLSALASSKGLTWTKDVSAVVEAATVASALKTYEAVSSVKAGGSIPVGTPIALVFVAAALLFLPSILSTAAAT